MHPHRIVRVGLVLVAALALMSPLSNAQAQAGAPAASAAQGPWTHDVNATQWGETPADVRGLLVKLQGVTKPGGPDAFDVVWLRELLRRPALYHLDGPDQLWMRRTIQAAEQAHLTHWQPALTAEAIPASTAPTAAPSVPAAPEPVVVARPTAPAVIAKPVPVARAVPPTPVVTAPPASVASASPDGLSTAMAMLIAAVVVSALMGLWIHRARLGGRRATPSL